MNVGGRFMKTFIKMFKTAFVFCIVMMAICSFVYPMALTGVSQTTMKAKANGSLIDKNGNPTTNKEEAVGSELLGQDFTEDYFFKGRVSYPNSKKLYDFSRQCACRSPQLYR